MVKIKAALLDDNKDQLLLNQQLMEQSPPLPRESFALYVNLIKKILCQQNL
jgi:hypothetical protein